MKKIAVQLLIGMFSVVGLFSQSGPQQNARLSIRSGLVELQRGNAWLPISAGQILVPGDHIRTAAGSTAALELGPGKVVTLNAESQIQIAPANSALAVQLEAGSMKIFSASDIRVAARDTVLETADRPVDLELGYDANRLNLTVFNGAVRNGPITIRGSNQDPTVRTYWAGPRGQRNDVRNGTIIVDPTFYVYPYFLYGNPDPNAGRIVPPVVNNPTNPGYRPGQIVPPMSDPIRVPVSK